MPEPIDISNTPSAVDLAVVQAQRPQLDRDTPYSPDEQRVADYLDSFGSVAGDDPIGFLILTHREAQMGALQQTYMLREVENGVPHSSDERRVVSCMRKLMLVPHLGPEFLEDPIGFLVAGFIHFTAGYGAIAERLEEYGLLDNEELAIDTLLDLVGALRAQKIAALEAASGGSHALFERLHIESLVREACGALGSGRPEGRTIDFIVDTLRLRMSRGDVQDALTVGPHEMIDASKIRTASVPRSFFEAVPFETPARSVTEDNSLFEKNGQWYFWDEAGLDRHGPYSTKDFAKEALDRYCYEVLEDKPTANARN